MAYVIAEPCINAKDAACVDACPTDCIHPRKDEEDFSERDMPVLRPRAGARDQSLMKEVCHGLRRPA